MSLTPRRYHSPAGHAARCSYWSIPPPRTPQPPPTRRPHANGPQPTAPSHRLPRKSYWSPTPRRRSGSMRLHKLSVGPPTTRKVIDTNTIRDICCSALDWRHRRTSLRQGARLVLFDLLIPVPLGRLPAVLIGTTPPVTGNGQPVTADATLDPQQVAPLLDEGRLTVYEGLHHAGRELHLPYRLDQRLADDPVAAMHPHEL